MESSARGLRARRIGLIELAIDLARLIVVAGVGEEVGEQVQRRAGRRGVARKLGDDVAERGACCVACAGREQHSRALIRGLSGEWSLYRIELIRGVARPTGTRQNLRV